MIMDIGNIFGYAGLAGLGIAFLCCLFMLLCSAFQIIKKGSNLTRVNLILSRIQTTALGLAVMSLGALLQGNRFEFSLVYESSETSMTWFEKLGGLWAGQSASILFWSFIFSVAITITIGISKRSGSSISHPALVFVLEFILIFFIIPDLFIFNPFQRTWAFPDDTLSKALFAPNGASLFHPVDGFGLNPSLRHIAMILHPPFIYSGLIGLFIPYAFSMASMFTGKDDGGWIQPIYPLTLLSWVLLTIGIALGSWWAYTILGWGGYWGWDAVEISGLLPCILSFALLHSMRMQIQGYPFRKWIYCLSGLTALLILFGILLTRSGLIESVHAYTRGAMGPILTGLIALNLAIYLLFLIKRLKKIERGLERCHRSIVFPIACLFNGLLVVLAFIYLFGQTLPLTSQLVSGKEMTFSPDQYKAASAPVLILIILVAALYLIARYSHMDNKKFWRIPVILLVASLPVPFVVHATTHTSVVSSIGYWVIAFLLISIFYGLWKDASYGLKRKNSKFDFMPYSELGKAMIHIGFAILCIGILSVETSASHQDIFLGTGDIVTVGAEQISMESQTFDINKNGYANYRLNLWLSRPEKNDIALIPFIEYYPKLNTFYSQPDHYSNLLKDIQVVINQIPETLEEKIAVRVYRFPLMAWIWIGSAMLAFGGIFSILTNCCTKLMIKNDRANNSG